MGVIVETIRRSSIHLSNNELWYKRFNVGISALLIIYCICQVVWSFLEDEKKIPDIIVNILTLVLSGVGAFITWRGRHHSRSVAPGPIPELS